MIIAVFQFGVARVCPFSVRRMVPNGVDRVVSVKSSANSARSLGSAAALSGDAIHTANCCSVRNRRTDFHSVESVTDRNNITDS